MRPFALLPLRRAILLPALLLIAWQLWAIGLPPGARAPTPVHVVAAFADLIATGGLLDAIGESFLRVLMGFLAAAAAGITLGIAIGYFPAVRRNVDPIIETFRPVAALAILPLAILWLGTGTPASVFIVAYAAFFPLVVNTAYGVSRVDRRLVQAALTLGLGRFAILRAVILPAAQPNVFVGARLAMGHAWTAIVAAELAVGAKAGGGTSGGIGQMMFVFYSYSVDLNGIVVCMIMVGLVALLIDRVFRLLERGLMPWRT
jgi:ABC-type nitrate/sulfonate/bicarbonate transport system permease component